MSGRYLTDLADVLRRAGLAVIEVDGWRNRARGSGGYSTGRPTHVMVHHTASGKSADGWGDVNYIATGSGDAPLSNLYLDRAGTWYVIAAGATNTNGSGHDSWGGGVPDDAMNTHAIGIEAGNDGLGEPWPPVMQDSYRDGVAALCAAYAIPTAHVRAHAEWAPGRKVDPAGPARWSPHPTGGGGGNTWAMDGFRADVATSSTEDTAPAPPSALDHLEMGEAMFIITSPGCGVALCAIGGGGVEWAWVYSGEDQNAFSAAGIPTVMATPAQFQALLDQSGQPVKVSPV
jgi:hypothetical protein